MATNEGDESNELGAMIAVSGGRFGVLSPAFW
jgi:hypothetical protein